VVEEKGETENEEEESLGESNDSIVWWNAVSRLWRACVDCERNPSALERSIQNAKVHGNVLFKQGSVPHVYGALFFYSLV
jgi:hypothetical protein